MGYGSRSLELLQLYYEGKLTTLDEMEEQVNTDVNLVATEVKTHFLINK